MTKTKTSPPFRKLRGYAFDPSLSLKMDTATINDIVYKIPWEPLEPGPVGEYIEVIDYDPTVKRFYEPVDLDDVFPLVQDGLDPSEADPRFHQQMVYAVAMLTIKNFEKALGRKIIWSFQRVLDKRYELYVPKLRIYPHAFRNANAYYSPVKKALLFGYFSATPVDETLNMPDSLVFTCLSHDIIAHETTHAILDGMHSNFNEATNLDMLAFHEAFADIVALFQHFTFPRVLEHQIAKTRGNLNSQNLLGQLAQQVGTAVGNYGSLRDAIGKFDEETKAWKPAEPNPDQYRSVKEPHSRGSILVAAVFEAFISIYKSRVSDLMRIASNGTGILPQGELHPDLVKRLSIEASKAAGHVLNMCIRALDYCPPVDLNFGDYLRAIITADLELVADDSRNYRLAFIDAFRRRGIYPDGIKTLSVDSLGFPLLDIGSGTASKMDEVKTDAGNVAVSGETAKFFEVLIDFLRDFGNRIKYVNDREKIYDITKDYISGNEEIIPPINGLHGRISKEFSSSLGLIMDLTKLTGLAFGDYGKRLKIRSSSRYPKIGAAFQILNLHMVSRVGPGGNQINDVIFHITQKSGVIYKDGKFQDYFELPPSYYPDDLKKQPPPLPEGGFAFKGGCTMIFDLDTQRLKYCITKPLIDMDQLETNGTLSVDTKRMEAQYRIQNETDDHHFNEYALYFSDGSNNMTEPFAFLHQH